MTRYVPNISYMWRIPEENVLIGHAAATFNLPGEHAGDWQRTVEALRQLNCVPKCVGYSIDKDAIKGVWWSETANGNLVLAGRFLSNQTGSNFLLYSNADPRKLINEFVLAHMTDEELLDFIQPCELRRMVIANS